MKELRVRWDEEDAEQEAVMNNRGGQDQTSGGRPDGRNMSQCTQHKLPDTCCSISDHHQKASGLDSGSQ